MYDNQWVGKNSESLGGIETFAYIWVVRNAAGRLPNFNGLTKKVFVRQPNED